MEVIGYVSLASVAPVALLCRGWISRARSGGLFPELSWMAYVAVPLSWLGFWVLLPEDSSARLASWRTLVGLGCQFTALLLAVTDLVRGLVDQRREYLTSGEENKDNEPPKPRRAK